MTDWQDTVPAQPWQTIGDRVVRTQPFRPFVGVGVPLPTGCAPAPLPGQTVVFDAQRDMGALRAQVASLQAEADEMRGFVSEAHRMVAALATAMEKTLQRLNAVAGLTAGHVQAFATLAPVLNQLRADVDGLALIQRAGRRPT